MVVRSRRIERFDHVEHGSRQCTPYRFDRPVLNPGEIDGIVALGDLVLIMVAIGGWRVVFDKQHTVRIKVEISGDGGGDVT